MSIKTIFKKVIGVAEKPEQPKTPPVPQNTFLQDIYFTSNFHARAKECGLTEEHARLVYYEGDAVPGKENMKVMSYKGEELGVYAFRDRLTNQPVITAIWKRSPRRNPSPTSETRR